MRTAPFDAYILVAVASFPCFQNEEDKGEMCKVYALEIACFTEGFTIGALPHVVTRLSDIAGLRDEYHIGITDASVRIVNQPFCATGCKDPHLSAGRAQSADR